MLQQKDIFMHLCPVYKGLFQCGQQLEGLFDTFCLFVLGRFLETVTVFVDFYAFTSTIPPPGTY